MLSGDRRDSRWVLKRDMHLHSRYSDGEADLEEIVARSIAVGLRRIAITDHFEYGRPNSVQASPQEYLQAFRRAQALGERHGLEVLLGVETGVAGGWVLCPEEILASADLVVASVHQIRAAECGRPGDDPSLWSEEAYWACYRQQVLQTARAEGVDVLGHVDGYLPARWERYPGATDFAGRRRAEAEIARRFLPLSFYRELAALLKDRGVAVELHGMSASPRVEVVRILRDGGCTFSIGSDAHTLRDLGNVRHAAAVAEMLDLRPEHFHPACR